MNSRSLTKRGQAVYQTAKLLSGFGGLQEHEDLKLLFGEVFRQHRDMFLNLLSNPKTLREVLRLGPEKTSALMHSNNLSYEGLEQLKRSMEQLFGVKLLACKDYVLAHDRQAVTYITRENFEVTTLDMYSTAKATAPAPRPAIRARNLVDLLRKLVEQTRAEQRDRDDTRNPRHPLYQGRFLLILENDKEGGSMKYGWSSTGQWWGREQGIWSKSYVVI